MQRAGQRDAVAQKGKHFGIGNLAWAMEKYRIDIRSVTRQNAQV